MDFSLLLSSYATVWSNPEVLLMTFIGALGGVLLGAIPGRLLAGGIKKLGKLERFQKYIDTMGNHTYCNFEQLSAAVNKPVKFVKKDIKKMIE